MSKRKTEAKRTKPQVLGDHKQFGKKFLPPLGQIPNLKPFHWLGDMMPELVWVALVLDSHGPNKSVSICRTLADVVSETKKPNPIRFFAFQSDYRDVQGDEARTIVARLREAGTLEDLRRALWPLVSLYPTSSLAFLYDDWRQRQTSTTEHNFAVLKRVVGDQIFRRGKPAMITQGVALAIMLSSGKLMVPRGSGIEKLQEIVHYPDTEDSRFVGSMIRSLLNTVPAAYAEFETTWCAEFWRQGYAISVCEQRRATRLVESEGEEAVSLDDVLDAGAAVRKELVELCEDTQRKAQPDLADPTPSEVVSGLISRQVRLASAIIQQPSLWALDLGPISLRCMVDTHITLAWLTKCGKPEDFASFIEYGLGQEKLLLEHLRAREKNGETFWDQEGVEAWLEDQILPQVLPVNVGAWNSRDTRKMAQEADCADVYSLGYTPFSSVLHPMWNSLAKFNLTYCLNPLHRHHKIPTFDEPPLTPTVAIEAIRIVNESLELWANYVGAPLRNRIGANFIALFRPKASASAGTGNP